MMPSLTNSGSMPISASGSTGDFMAKNHHKTSFQMGGIQMGSPSSKKWLVVGAFALGALYIWKKK